ncbi:AraC family transcriptional regulator [Paenibacillus abyssi]|uniref:AraC family transcriptional regulator n=1 Tax=Paenibacillus abyssi TaxID=1340531 RepID=A0A917CNS3_9BACL|nr:AraC family transcriptional regulator [Paenibacillus abyssi]GGF92737.1 AraC family transcriptional regulator [Paenibacillus abyssi]
MKDDSFTFWRKYVAKAQLDLMSVAYTKVPTTWRNLNFIPDYNKFYYIIEGEGYLKIKDKEYYPKPGELYLIPSGALQSYDTINDHTFGKYWCHFLAKIGELNLFQLIEMPVHVVPSDPDGMKQKFEQLIRYANTDSLSSEFRVNSILFDMIAVFLEESASVKFNLAASASFEKMSHVLHYIETHLSDNVSVDELAQIAHFHPNYFIQVFKGFTGYSPIQYINRMRLEKAKHLVIMTDLNMSAIADALGMELPYFSRMFKEHTGFSPTAYREMVPKAGGLRR